MCIEGISGDCEDDIFWNEENEDEISTMWEGRTIHKGSAAIRDACERIEKIYQDISPSFYSGINPNLSTISPNAFPPASLALLPERSFAISSFYPLPQNSLNHLTPSSPIFILPKKNLLSQIFFLPEPIEEKNFEIKALDRQKYNKTLDFVKPKEPLNSVWLPPLGIPNEELKIQMIPGMNTKIERSLEIQNYIRKLIPDRYTTAVDLLYNKSHGALFDLSEVFIYNYNGISPNTEDLLKTSWLEFHEKHKNSPKKKILQFCHSQGAIHVSNALDKLTQEITNRVIVIAIAPAKVISKEQCFQVFNYASKSDIVSSYGELAHAYYYADEEEKFYLMEEISKRRKEGLTLLEPKGKGMDHDFTSPTFEEHIKKHIDEYFRNKGEYDF